MFLLKKFFITEAKKLMKNKKKEEEGFTELDINMVENVHAAIQSHFYRLDIKCYVNLLPYRFCLHRESCICSLYPLFLFFRLFFFHVSI